MRSLKRSKKHCAKSMDSHLRSAAEEALSCWETNIAELALLPMRENICFRVTDVAGERHILRLHRPGYHSLKELKSEQLWIRALREVDIDVPVPVPTSAGSHYAEVKVCGHLRYVDMLKWVNGVTMLSLSEDETDGEVLAEKFYQIGVLLAKIHNQACAWELPENFSRHSFNSDGLVGEHPFWGRFWEGRLTNKEQRCWLREARHKVCAILTRYGEAPETYSLIHADLHPGNVIVNGGQLHIIDFDDSGFGWHQYDFSNALFSYRKHREFPVMQKALFKGYRQHRCLSDQAISYVPLFLVIRALACIGWYSDRPELDEQNVSRLIEYSSNALEGALAMCS